MRLCAQCCLFVATGAALSLVVLRFPVAPHADLVFHEEKQKWEDLLSQEEDAQKRAQALADEIQRIELQEQRTEDFLEGIADQYALALRDVRFLAEIVLIQRAPLRDLLTSQTEEVPKLYMIQLLHPVLIDPLPHHDQERALHLLTELRADPFTLLEDLLSIPKTTAELAQEHTLVKVQHAAAIEEYEELQTHVLAPTRDIEENRRIVANVRSQIDRLTAEQDRITLQLQRSIERRLVQEGKIRGRKGFYAKNTGFGFAQHGWPALGPISATFLEPSYKQYFGVPHYGIDIAVEQGTSVLATADGLVFHIQDGGPKGYSYVLLSHAGGQATLYGHLSAIHVPVGQEVRRGQVLGYSGGIPGTHGAGPMTTGAHVHLEVIQNGQHVDPLDHLPSTVLVTKDHTKAALVKRREPVDPIGGPKEKAPEETSPYIPLLTHTREFEGDTQKQGVLTSILDTTILLVQNAWNEVRSLWMLLSM